MPAGSPPAPGGNAWPRNAQRRNTSALYTAAARSPQGPPGGGVTSAGAAAAASSSSAAGATQSPSARVNSDASAVCSRCWWHRRVTCGRGAGGWGGWHARALLGEADRHLLC